MSVLAPLAILRGDLREHPAVRAWRALGPSHVEPESIEVLRERGSSSLYRLRGVEVGGSAVVAKRGRRDRVAVERTIYEKVLSRLPVSAPRYYGSFEGEGGELWLFLGDVGEERYSDRDPTQRVLAGRWLAQMHGLAAGLFPGSGPPPGIPDGGPARYLEHLRRARERVLRRLPAPELPEDDVAALESLVGELDAIEARWSGITRACEGALVTVIHGDFRPKNVYLRRDHEGVTLLPIDWETAGWGPTAVDLTRLDLDAYRAALREYWPGTDPGEMRDLERVGQVFRYLAGVGWETIGLDFEAYKFVSRPLASLRVLKAKLVDAVRAVGVET